MIFEIEEAKSHCDWLLDRGLGLGECANVLCDMQCGDTFSLALLKVFKHRSDLLDRRWDIPITP